MDALLGDQRVQVPEEVAQAAVEVQMGIGD
jgi:hypothetical protein